MRSLSILSFLAGLAIVLAAALAQGGFAVFADTASVPSNTFTTAASFGGSDGTVKAEQKISDTAGGLAATLDNSDNFGRAVAMIGDVDGDGIIDIVVGANNDDDGGSNRGAVYVLFLTAV